MIDEEYEKRKKFLGKNRANHREGFLLKRVLENPFPNIIDEGPIHKYPSEAGWLYHNMDVIKARKINLDVIRSYLEAVERVFLNCFEYANSRGGRLQPNPVMKFYQVDSRGIYVSDEKVREIISDNMTLDQAKTYLHYFAFYVGDQNGSLWGERKQ